MFLVRIKYKDPFLIFKQSLVLVVDEKTAFKDLFERIPRDTEIYSVEILRK